MALTYRNWTLCRCLPCRRSRVRVPSAALTKAPLWRGFRLLGPAQVAIKRCGYQVRYQIGSRGWSPAAQPKRGEARWFGVVSGVRWPCGRDAQPRPDCHQRRIVRHAAGGLGYWFRLRGRCRTSASVMPGYAEPRSKAAHRPAREAAQRMTATFERAAEALERSAVLADDHAQRLEQAGRHEAAAKEHAAADRAREAGRRARARVDGADTRAPTATT
jgi:hypothetical protein